MPCRNDPSPAEIEAGRRAAKERELAAKAKLKSLERDKSDLQTEIAIQACEWRGLICSLVENDVPLSSWARGEDYQAIREEHLRHRRFDQQRKLEELTAQLVLANIDEAAGIRNLIIEVAGVTSDYDLLAGTDLF